MLCRLSAYYELLGAFILYSEHALFNGEEEKESIIIVRMGKKNTSFLISICHHSSSLAMPNSDL